MPGRPSVWRHGAPAELQALLCDWAVWMGGPLRGPLLQVFGLGAVAHMVLGGKLGSYLAVNLGFGFGVTIGVHMAGNISGE